jgi:hypothetical protein
MKTRFSSHYKLTAFGGDEGKKRLSRALKALNSYCVGPRVPPAGADDVHIAMAAMTFWPSVEELKELDDAVTALALVEGKKKPTPTWASYKLVGQRFRGLGLLRSIEGLVARTERLLNEERKADHSRLTQLRTEASAGGGKMKARALLGDIRSIREKLGAARSIDWERHEAVLFPDRRRYLACGDDTAQPRVSCYARAMEIVVEAENFPAPNRDKAGPLLDWIARLGNPDYVNRLSFDPWVQLMAKNEARRSAEAKAATKRAKAAERQRWHRYLNQKKVSC